MWCSLTRAAARPEDPPERQVGAVRAGRVGVAQQGLVLRHELVAYVVGQRRERGPGTGAADPGEDGILTGEQVQVCRLPGVDAQPEVAQRGGIHLRVVGERAGHAAGELRVARLVGEPLQQCVAGLVMVAGHLEGEPAPGRNVADQPRQQLEVAGHPLVGQYH